MAMKEMIIPTVVPICLFLLVISALLALRRLLIGPTIIDRIVGFDMTTVCIIGMMVLLSVWWDTHLFIEIMLIFSLLGFVGAIAYVSYLHLHPGKIRSRDNATPVFRKGEDS